MRLLDGHCDTACQLWREKAPLAKNACHIDLAEASAFDGYAQFFAFCSLAGCSEDPEALLTLPLENLRREVEKNAERIAFASTGDEVLNTLQQGKAAALLSIEGAEVIGCDVNRLPWLREQGFRMASLTWNADNALAGWHGSERGLSAQGKAFVRTAQELGILIDVSHLGERAFWDLVDITTKPILASHSNCRALCAHTRNLTDDQLRAIAQSGGTVGLNLYAEFLGEDPDFETVLRHLEHMLRLCGEEHVALGGDLDGCDLLPKGFVSVASYASLYDYLRGQGYEAEFLDRLFFTNLLRLLE